MSASTCIHVQQKHVFLLHQLGKELPQKHQPTPCILSFHDKNRNSPEFQDTVGSIATHTKGGKESAQNEPGVPAVVKLCIFQTFHENLVKVSQWRPCVDFFWKLRNLLLKSEASDKNWHNKSSYEMISKPTSFSIFLNLTPPCLRALRQLPYIYRDASLSARVLESAQAAWEAKNWWFFLQRKRPMKRRPFLNITVEISKSQSLQVYLCSVYIV